MIKRIKVHNFLSLKDIDLELGARNVLVGANMSGKSNLIECLEFLKDALSPAATNNVLPLQSAFSSRGGFGEVVWKGQPEGPIGIALQAELQSSGKSGKRPISHCYELSLRPPEYGHPRVESEILSITADNRSETVVENAAGKLKVIQDDQKIDGPQNTQALGVRLYARDNSSELSRFLNFVMGWRFYHLVPALMRTSNAPAWEDHLFEHGENLSAWLLVLQNYPEEFRRLKQACCDVLSGLAEILFQPVEPPQQQIQTGTLGTASFTMDAAKISIGAAERPFNRPMSLARMSDGELAFLGLISVIFAPEELTPPLLCIEEPENYLHPRLIEVLVELLNQRATEAHPPQVIMTTHSPLLVDRLSIDDLVVVEKSEGASRFTRPSTKKHLRKLLSSKEASLGDLWYSGALTDS